MAISDLKRFMVPGALVIGGVTAGSMLAPVAFAAAQDDPVDDSDQATETSDPAEDEGRRGRRGHHGRHLHLGRQIGIGVVTDALGITAEEVRAGFDEGKTLAEIAADNGVAADDLKAALMDEATEHIDRAVADERIDADRAAELKEGLSERIDELMNSTPGEGGYGHGRQRGFGGGERGEALAEFLGTTTEDLRAALADGQTLAEVAEAQGVSEDELVAFLVDSLEERLDDAVEAGRLDADDVEEKLAEAEERISEHVNAEPGERFGGKGFGHRGQGHDHSRGDGDGADSDADDADTDGETVDSSLDV